MGLDTAKDIKDDQDQGLFARAKKKLGNPNKGECYGFFPALALGGSIALEHLKRVRALEHFSIIGTLSTYEWFNVEDGAERHVRRIGR